MITVIPRETKVSKLAVKASKKAAKLTFTKPTTNSKIQIQYSTKKNFKSKSTKTINKAGSYTLKKLKSKKTYYFRVRYKLTVEGKAYYRAWSSTKKTKVK